MLECIRQLVNVDRDWVPDNQKASLYIRPTMIGTEPSLGVSVSFLSNVDYNFSLSQAPNKSKMFCSFVSSWPVLPHWRLQPSLTPCRSVRCSRF